MTCSCGKARTLTQGDDTQPVLVGWWRDGDSSGGWQQCQQLPQMPYTEGWQLVSLMLQAKKLRAPGEGVSYPQHCTTSERGVRLEPRTVRFQGPGSDEPRRMGGVS